MSLPTPSIIDRTRRWIRLLKRGSRSPTIPTHEVVGGEFFSNAQDFTISDAQFINELKISYINDVVSSRQAVFEVLEPYTCLDATKDSSARHPPPKCHPNTRLKIRERLTQWAFNEGDEQKMLWVRGSAGTGKSAVAQSFGDSCEEGGNHGGSYFFSRTTNRNEPKTVVPTLVYQLAMNFPEYHSFIERRLATTPLLLRNSPPVQFRKLIVEPFATLQSQGSRRPIVIILDGLDECDGEDAQRELLEMITNGMRSNPDLPFRWLIFSRPEAHLKNAFSRNVLCGRDELVIDAECREDVERYIKDRLAKIKDTYNQVTPTEWPSTDKLQELLDAVSGLFVLASTCLNFIDDPRESDPDSQLDSLLMFMHRSQSVLSRNPLSALDLLYSWILDDIPDAVMKSTRRILAYMSHRRKMDVGHRLYSAQALSNFLRLDQRAFYKALRGLHSVMIIPDPEDAAKLQLQFYHASFQDFLLDPNRSGKFAIGEQEVLEDIVQSSIYWHDIDVTHFHKSDGWKYDINHRHDSLPNLTWASEDDQAALSRSITRFVDEGVLTHDFDLQLDCLDETFLSRLSDLDYTHWLAADILYLTLLCQLDTLTSMVRVEPSSPTDHQLLDCLNLVTENGVAKPATSPIRRRLPDDRWTREYFFLGHGAGSVIVWRTKSPTSLAQFAYSLCYGQEPTEAQLSLYRGYLQDISWDEERAKLEME